MSNNQKNNVPEDANDVPTIECKFKKGDKVTFVNDSGIKFSGLEITGFSPTIEKRFPFYLS